MAKRIVTRGDTTFFTFVFYDEDDNVAVVTSAKLQLTYPGVSDFVTEVLDLVGDDDTWSVSWRSASSRPGWVEFHAHAYAADDVEYDQDGRFRLTGNRANLDHEIMPTTGTASQDAMISGSTTDYV